MTAAEAPNFEEVCNFAEHWVERWNAHDVDGIISLVSSDVMWADPSLENIARGHEESRQYITSLFRAFPDISWSMPSGLCVSPANEDGVTRIAQPWACCGTVLGSIDPPGFAPTGRSFELEGVDLWELRQADRLLSRVVSHYDALDFARRIDLMPARGTTGERLLVRLQRARERIRQ